MSLFKKAVLVAGIVMLMPTDARRQSEIVGAAESAVDRTVTFCDRNPGSCAAGRELWDTFVRKAEFGLALTSGVARDYITRGMESAHPTAPLAYKPPRHPPVPEPAPRIEPASSRDTLTRTDVAPHWRGR